MDSPSESHPEPSLVDLDRAATTPLDPLVRAAMEAAEARFLGNPSSRHGLGLEARRAIAEARASIARALDAPLEGVIFTSGATEANNLAVLGHARAQRREGRHALIGAAEHPSVAEAGDALAREGFEVERIPLDTSGLVDLQAFAKLLRPDTVLVAQMLVNNLLGTIAPVARMARLVRAQSPAARLHVDAVQALGKIPVSLEDMGVHSCAISAHKIHGPRGAGALLLVNGTRIEPLAYGGGQESGLRPGTENVAGIIGLAEALRLTLDHRRNSAAHLGELREILTSAIDSIPGARVLAAGDRTQAVASILGAYLPGPPAEVWLHHLDQAGVLSSVGSACQSRSKSIPAAYLALGLSNAEAKGVLRLSTSRTTTTAEAQAGATRLRATAKMLESLGLMAKASTETHR
ncbi:MAG: cysteine desulfurase [Planctomycetota bacterium]|jgi:cysteine desulfurase